MKHYSHDEFIRLRDSHFYDSFERERTQKYRELDEFKKIFSREALKTMKIEDYVQGLGSNDSFCYHIERTFGCFGNITSSSAYKFGIFFSKSRNQYEYYPKWGDSTEEAYDNVRDLFRSFTWRVDMLVFVQHNPLQYRRCAYVLCFNHSNQVFLQA